MTLENRPHTYLGQVLIEEVNDICLTAMTPNDLLNKLYQLFKANNKKVSMLYICRILSISSTGYLTNIMQGKRKLNKIYATKFAKFFSLTPKQIKILMLLVELENTKDAIQQKKIMDQ